MSENVTDFDNMDDTTTATSNLNRFQSETSPWILKETVLSPEESFPECSQTLRTYSQNLSLSVTKTNTFSWHYYASHSSPKGLHGSYCSCIAAEAIHWTDSKTCGTIEPFTHPNM